MMDENDRSHEDYRSLRHISRKEGPEDTAPIEVDSSAFFSELPPEQPSTPPPAQPPQKPPRSGHNTPVPPKAHPPVDGAVAVPSKWGKILLILQGILSILALVQLWRTQMLPVLYLVILAALLALLWLLVKRCQEYNVPGKVARVFSVFLCAAMALGCFWAQQGLSALGSMTSGLLTGAEANKITKEPFVIYLSGVDTRGELTENARSDVNILAAVNPVTKRVALINWAICTASMWTITSASTLRASSASSMRWAAWMSTPIRRSLLLAAPATMTPPPLWRAGTIWTARPLWPLPVSVTPLHPAISSAASTR